MDIGYIFKETALKYKDKIAIINKYNLGWEKLSYGDLYRQVMSLAHWFNKEEVHNCERVAIILANRKEWPAIFLSIVESGAVVVPINAASPQKEIENILKDSEPKIIFTDDNSFLLKQNTNSVLSFAKKIISVDSPVFAEIMAKSIPQEEMRPVSINDDDLACILYTSGTTNEPKGVMLSHKNLLSNYSSLVKLNLLSNKDKVISILPLYHAYPLMGTLILPLLCGAVIVYPKSLQGEDILEAMQYAEATKFIAVPELLYLFHHKIKAGIKNIFFPFRILLKIIIEILWFIRKVVGLNLTRILLRNLHKKFGSNFDFFVSGGAHLDKDTEENFFKLGFTIIQGYGLTETSPVLTINPISKPKIGSAGRAIPGVEIKINNKDKEGIGEVIARGENIMSGYYKRPDLTKDVIKDNWFYTGDLGCLDKEGYLFLTGRQKDVIVLSSGKNIFPEEIEAHYGSLPFIKEICVFETALKKGGIEKSDVLYAVVVPNLDYFKKQTEINLRAVIKERFENLSRELPSYKRIMGFILTHQVLPRTALGKVKRYLVKEMYLGAITKEGTASIKQAELKREDKVILENELVKKILAYLQKQAKINRQIYLDDGLEIDLGMDSLSRIELISGLESILGMKLSEEEMAGIFTVRELIKKLEILLLEKNKITDKKEISSVCNYWRGIIQIPPQKENLEKIDLSPGLFSKTAAFLLNSFMYLFFKIFYDLKIEGANNIPKEGPFILYPNHTSYFDGFIIAASAPKYIKLDLFFVGFRPYFDVSIIRNFIKIGRIIPLDFSSYLLEALRSSFYVLKNNKKLCIFPEGLRAIDENIREFKKGFGILAKESQAKLIPVFINGALKAWPRTAKFPHSYPIRVKFGKPLDIERLEKEGFRLNAKDSYEAICLAAREELMKLK